MAIIPCRLTLIKHWWRLLIILSAPLVLLPLPILIKNIQSRCAYVVILLTVYWVSEAMPYAVTSLFPLAFFPMAGIVPSEKIGLNYFKDIQILFVGSMILAHAMEHVNLHRRLALLVLSLVGSSIKWSMAGLMIVTAFLSMWINNSAATSIMIPATVAIIDELQKNEQDMRKTSVILENGDLRKSKEIVPLESTIVSHIKTYDEEQETQPPAAEGFVPIDLNEEPNAVQSQRSSITAVKSTSTNHLDYEKLKTGFLISVAYSSAIGGLATLVGTGPNVFVKGFSDEFYATGPHEFEVSFTNFLEFAFPIGVVMLITSWFCLQLIYNRRELNPWLKKDANELKSQKHLQSFLKDQYKELGSPDWKEWTIIILFVVMVVLWVTRDFSTFPGWEIIFIKGYVTDGTVSLLIGSLPLIIPDKNPFSEKWEYRPILPWDHLSKTFPWGIFMLQGAGLAIADAFRASELSIPIAHFLQFIVGASDITIIFVVIVLSAIFTEFTSNLACATILFPVLDGIAHAAGIHAARLILPSCIAVSLSYMLPIATPPNAMIFSTGNVRIIDMIKAGFIIKIVGIAIILFFSIVSLPPIFRIHPITPLLNDTLLLNNNTSQ